MSLGVIAIFLGVTTVAAFVQGTFGFGFAVVCVPILTLVHPDLTPVPQLYAQVLLLSLTFLRERKHTEWRGVKWTSVGRIPGMIVAVFILGVASQRALDLLIGAMVFVGVLGSAFGRAIPRNTVTELIAGAASSLGAVLAAIGGPPTALLYKDAKGPVVRSTLSVISLVGIVTAIAARALTEPFSPEALKLGLMAMPAAAFGLFMSRYVTGKVEGKGMRLGILFISGISASLLLGRGFFGY